MDTSRKRHRVLVVDGNNVIHAWQDLLDLHLRPSAGTGRVRSGRGYRELERRLTHYQDETGVRVVLVFDGRGEQLEQSDPRDRGIQVVRSDSATSADTVIERLTARYAAEYDLEVASDDRAVQNAVAAMQATWISSDGLRDRVEGAERKLVRRIEAQRK